MKLLNRPSLINRRSLALATAVPLILLAVFVGLTVKPPTHAASTAPASPPVTWCEDPNFPGDQSPYASAPAGAVTVPAGDNSSFGLETANTTYWFAPGTHTIGTSQYSQIDPGKGSTYMGAPGAILDGQNANSSAFVGVYNDTSDENVTIEYLTIQHFAPNQGSGSVNANGNNGWTEKYNRMQYNSPGAAMMLGGNNTVTNNCLTNNGEYGAQGYSYVDENYETTFTGGAINITFSGNDVSFNNTQRTTTGIEGGVKFWQNGNVNVTGNYFHDNIDSPGVWMDTDNAGFLVQNNYISNNGAEGLFYEISYNAQIIDNTFVNNANVDGPSNPGFPTGAIYISESGGDSRVPSNYAGQLNIQGNQFTDNWAGVVVYQNANRYIGDGQDPGSLVPPSGVNVNNWIDTVGPQTCPSNLTTTSPIDYHMLCQWHSQNVTVQNNVFNFNPNDATYGGKCNSSAPSCGQNGLFSDYSSTPAYPAYTECNWIVNTQNNHFLNNTYTGPWTFNYFNQGDVATWSQWTTGLTNVEGSGYNFGAQDAGSTYNSSPAPTGTPASPTPTPTPTPTPSPTPTPTPPPPTPTPTPITGAFNIGEKNVLGALDNSNAGYLQAQSAPLSQAATINSLSVYVSTAAGNMRLGVYDSSGPSAGPGVLKAQTAEFSPVVGWNTANVTAPVSLTPGTYWLAFIPSDNNLGMQKTSDTTSSSFYCTIAYGPLPSNFCSPAAASTSHWSFYATLNSSSGKIGDLNNDNQVNIFDLSILLSAWGTANPTADLNHDNTVNIFDLSIFLSHWGT
jgi:hypothetical protein